jgi:hypothetical protein
MMSSALTVPCWESTVLSLKRRPILLDHAQRDGFPGDPREWEKRNAGTAQFSPLGEKPLGLARW